MPRLLVSGSGARAPVQAACAQALIDGAKRLANLKPPQFTSVRTVAIIGFPDMFSSEICLFFDPAYFASFCDRDSDEERWTAISGASLAETLALALPEGFAERGYQTVYRDDTYDPPLGETGQTWLIGELDA